MCAERWAGERAAAELWEGTTIAARLARTALLPLSAAYGAVTGIRRWAYDRALLPIAEPEIPVVAIGNLTVGGTGKTPIAAWVASTLAARGAHPAVVLRGYRGGDETAVHHVLNPTLPVIAGADRRDAVARAHAEGCDIAVLDDAFQHRGIARSADIVLLSADAAATSEGGGHLLPAGPWREPLTALRRATIAVVTRKAASDATVAALEDAIADAAPQLPTALAELSLGELRSVDGDSRPLESLRGAPVYAFAGIGDPAAFFAQLRAFTPHVHTTAFADHRSYTISDITTLVSEIQRCAGPEATVVCTLKDAVKLAALWPRAAGGVALWFVSQRVVFERGDEAVEAILDAAMQGRPGAPPVLSSAARRH